MSYKVLHIIDHWLPDTMNWLDALLDSTGNSCTHFISCEYLVTDPNPKYYFIRPGLRLNYPVSMIERIKKVWKRSQMLKHLSSWLATNEVHAIHVHFGHMAIRYKDWLVDSGRPIIISLYGFDYEFLIHKDPSALDCYRELALCGAQFIVEGNYSRQLLIRYGIPVHQISIVHLLFHREVETNLQSWNYPVRLLQVATYTEKKNQLEFLEALQDRHAGKFTLTFFGEFYDKVYVMELKRVVQRKPKHAISIFGKLKFDDYLIELNHAHFCMQWSKRSASNDTEGGCPVFIKDSLGQGRPVIGSKHCDIPDILVHGFNAFVTDEQDPYALAAILDEVLEMNTHAYLKMQRNAILSVYENMAGKMSGNELIEVYRKFSS